MQLRAPHRRKPVIQRTPHQLVGEAVLQPPGRERLDHAGGDRLLQRGRERALGCEAHDLQPELGPDGGRDLQQVARPGVQPRHAPAHDLRTLSGVPSCPPSASDRHSSHTRNALPPVERVDRAGEQPPARLRLGARTPRPRPSRAHRAGAARCRRSDGGRASVSASASGSSSSRKVASTSTRIRPPGSREVTQQPERRRVGPVRVLDHQQDRAFPCEPLEQAGDAGVEPVPFACRGPRRRVRRDPERRLRVELLERLHGTGRTADGRRRRTPRTGRGRRARPTSIANSPHQPALAGAGLAADERDAPSLALRPRDQRAQHRQLARAPDEREPRPQAQRARQQRHSQI